MFILLITMDMCQNNANKTNLIDRLIVSSGGSYYCVFCKFIYNSQNLFLLLLIVESFCIEHLLYSCFEELK